MSISSVHLHRPDACRSICESLLAIEVVLIRTKSESHCARVRDHGKPAGWPSLFARSDKKSRLSGQTRATAPPQPAVCPVGIAAPGPLVAHLTRSAVATRQVELVLVITDDRLAGNALIVRDLRSGHDHGSLPGPLAASCPAARARSAALRES